MVVYDDRPLIQGRCDLDKKEELELRIEEIKKELEAAGMNSRKETFLRRVTSPFRILPSFLIIGVLRREQRHFLNI